MSKQAPYHDWDELHDEKKLYAFLKKVQDMADQEFGVDDTGDSSVEIRLTDRTRGHMPPFRPVPYGHKDEATRKEAFETAVFNLNVAHGTFETEDRIRCHKEHQGDTEPQKLLAQAANVIEDEGDADNKGLVEKLRKAAGRAAKEPKS